MDQTCVTIVIPTFNMANFIGIAISSCLKQTYKNIKIIVCDNASNDNTRAVISQFNDERITYYRHELNIGAIANFNFAIEKTSSNYLKFLEADDFLHINAIERQMLALKQNDNVGLVSCGKYFIDGDNSIIGEHVIKHSRLIKSPYSFFRFFLMGNEFGTPSDVLINLEVFEKKLLNFDSLYESYLNDWDLWFRISQKCNTIILNEKLTYVRRHLGQIGNSQSLNNKDIFVNFKMIDKLHTSNFAYFVSILHISSAFLVRAIKKCIKHKFKQNTILYFVSTSRIIVQNSTGLHYILSFFYMLFLYPFILLFQKIADKFSIL